MDKQKKVSKLLILLGEYLGFSVLCGWVSFLFFLWTSRVIANNYSLKTGTVVTVQTEYWLSILCAGAGVFLTLFVLFLLLQKKLFYIIKMSSLVEQMEAGNIELEIPLEGNDELTDLALCINHLVRAMSHHLQQSEDLTRERFATITTLSHDLRTPLTSVMSYLQLIQDGQYDSEEQLHLYADRAFAKAEHIKEMSDHLFDSCQLEESFSGDAAPKVGSLLSLEQIEGAFFLKTALAETEIALTDQGYQVHLSSALDGCVFYLMVNQSLISRIFENIISNIEKYADPKAPVEFKVELKDQKMILQQTNQSLDSLYTADVESHLVGLKSVEQGLHQMGGSLLVREEENTFFLEIRLPIC